MRKGKEKRRRERQNAKKEKKKKRSDTKNFELNLARSTRQSVV